MMSFVSWMLTTRRRPARCLEFEGEVVVVGQRPGDGILERPQDREGVIVGDAIGGGEEEVERLVELSRREWGL